jgi:hypothetical protein
MIDCYSFTLGNYDAKMRELHVRSQDFRDAVFFQICSIQIFNKLKIKVNRLNINRISYTKGG